jgi:hypothetical protein
MNACFFISKNLFISSTSSRSNPPFFGLGPLVSNNFIGAV